MPAAQTTEAILLRRARFGESSYVLIWLSPGHGKIRTTARGTARRDSRLRGRLDLFYHAEIQFAAGRKSDLHALRGSSWSKLGRPCGGITPGCWPLPTSPSCAIFCLNRPTPRRIFSIFCGGRSYTFAPMTRRGARWNFSRRRPAACLVSGMPATRWARSRRTPDGFRRTGGAWVRSAAEVRTESAIAEPSA